jgi:hypothetical protein
MTALMHVKGWGAPETKAAAERARLLIEQAEALGEPPDDPLLLFSVLHSSWVGALGIGADTHLKLAAQVLTLAEKQSMTAPLMTGHRVIGASLAVAGNLMGALAHFNQAIALYVPAEHRPLVTRFGGDTAVVAVLSLRSEGMWMLGYPDAAAADAKHALKDAREIGHALTLMIALRSAASTHTLRGSYATASAQADELVALADEKGASPWKISGILIQGRLRKGLRRISRSYRSYFASPDGRRSPIRSRVHKVPWTIPWTTRAPSAIKSTQSGNSSTPTTLIRHASRLSATLD